MNTIWKADNEIYPMTILDLGFRILNGDLGWGLGFENMIFGTKGLGFQYFSEFGKTNIFDFGSKIER